MCAMELPGHENSISGTYKWLESSFIHFWHVPALFPGAVERLAQVGGHLQFACSHLSLETKQI